MPASEFVHGDEKNPVMSSPVVTDNGASNEHLNGQNLTPNIDELTVASPLSSPKPIVVTKSRNGTHIHSSNQVTESMNIVRAETRTEFSSRTQSRATNVTESGILKFGSDRQVLVLRETVSGTRNRFIRDLEHVNEHHIDSMTIDSFLDYIESERLTHMPHHGSRWDKVLKWAEFYAVQIAGFQKAVSPFLQDSKSAAQLIWVASRLLLEVSFQNFP